MRIRTERLTWREVDDEIIALDLDRSSYFTANPAGAVIMKLLAGGGVTEDRLVDALLEEFDVERSVAARDVETFLSDLERDGLLDREG